MEKKNSVKKTVSKKEEKKEEKVSVVKTSKKDNRIIFKKESKKVVKVVSYIGMFFASAACIFIFVFGIMTTLKVANSTKSELIGDNFSLTFISNINFTSIAETKEIITDSGSTTLLIAFNVIIPAIAIIASCILFMIILSKILNFFDKDYDITEKELYTRDNLSLIEKVACLTECILIISLIVFDRPTILLYLLVSVLLFSVIGLFNKCIENQK